MPVPNDVEEPRTATVIAVEGASDKLVLERIARNLGRDLVAEGIRIVSIGGAQAIRRFVSQLEPGLAVRGLCDENERRFFHRALDEVYVCTPDLEGELIRAIGVERMLEIIDRRSFTRMQHEPDQRGRPIELQLHRWLRSSSSRYRSYLPVLVDALDRDRIPTPLRSVLG